MRTTNASGFTLLEITVTIAIMGTLVAVAIPAFSKYISKSKTSEVYVNLGTIAALERAYYIDHREYLACPANPARTPHKPTVWPASEPWTKLGFQPDGHVRYQYEVAVSDKHGFAARAYGDLDRDGERSRFELTNEMMSIRRENELE